MAGGLEAVVELLGAVPATECAVIDISMPGMNGLELGRRLRQRFPATQLCLIALTGYADADLR